MDPQVLILAAQHYHVSFVPSRIAREALEPSPLSVFPFTPSDSSNCAQSLLSTSTSPYSIALDNTTIGLAIPLIPGHNTDAFRGSLPRGQKRRYYRG